MNFWNSILSEWKCKEDARWLKGVENSLNQLDLYYSAFIVGILANSASLSPELQQHCTRLTDE